MTVKICPKCGKKTFRIENVISTTQMIHWRCTNCCNKARIPYGQEIIQVE